MIFEKKQYMIKFKTETSYRAHPAISSTHLKEYLSCQADYFEYQGIDASDAMNLGSALHDAFLSGGENVINLGEKIDGRTSEGKAQALKKKEAKENGFFPVFEDQWQDIERSIKAIKKHPAYNRLFGSKNINELGIGLDHPCGAKYKIKPDSFFISKKSGRVVPIDLKKCLDASQDGFLKEARKRNFLIQEALYRIGLEQYCGVESGQMHWVMVQFPTKNKPARVGVYTIADWQTDYARTWVHRSIKEIHNIQQSNLPYSAFENTLHELGIHEDLEFSQHYINQYL